MELVNTHDLIVTIVRRGWSDRIIDASRDAGAEGGTVVYGRGTGIHEHRKLFGIPIDPEKELILTIIPQNLTEPVLDAIITAGNLNKPGTGIAFVVELKKVVGIVHLIDPDLDHA